MANTLILQREKKAGEEEVEKANLRQSGAIESWIVTVRAFSTTDVL